MFKILSKYDIEKELGKGINIVPFNPKNLKENSINLSISKFAWTLKSGDVFISSKNHLSNTVTQNSTALNFKVGDSVFQHIHNEEFIILLPLSTTLIQTNEVLAVSNHIGGCYHSKVGIVSLGVGHIGTMLGPNFAGHSMIALHNHSESPLKLSLDETFVSLTFYYLHTPIDYPNHTINSHIDKVGGLKLSKEDKKFLLEDWKSNVTLVQEAMENDKNFIHYKKLLRKRKLKYINSFLNLRNIILTIVGVSIFVVLYFFAKELDSNTNKTI